MSETYHVRVEKEHLIFSAAHFITFNGNICERLHGHNYRVFAEVHGPLDENAYVIDFIALRDTLKEIVNELDHHMLLPTEHPKIQVTAGETEVEVTFEDRRWVFPRGDCILLPVSNTTAELMARYIGQQLLERLETRTGSRPQRLVLGVDENEGQWGICELPC
ncbi:MAG: 6-pyruvoyl tetrahydropterin synthase family protein [Planctomycetota bacterium]|nr:6-pyruvoyl tetrahydropterin synthase family protein [Planctomycetota bacterium]